MSDPVDFHRPDRDDERLDVLTLAALREPLSPAVAEHVRSCATCTADLRQLTATVDLAREGVPPVPAGAPRPPNTVWNAIAREVGAATPPAPSGSPPPPPVAPSTARPVRHRPRRRWVAALAAAVVVIGAAVVGGYTAGRAGVDRGGCPTVGAALSPIGAAASGVTGTAELVCSADGRALRVRTERLPIGTGFYEVWMYQPDSGAMVPVGALGSDGSGTFTLPGGMDVRDYPVVDVSAQQYDNDPAHGTSVLQGPLTR